MSPSQTQAPFYTPPRSELSPRAQKALRLALYANLAGLVAYVLQSWLDIANGEVDGFARDWLWSALIFLSAAICIARGMLIRGERLPWTLLGGSIVVHGLGSLWFGAVAQHVDPPPSPSVGDVLWMAFYPGCYAALVLLMRGRVALQSRALLGDGAVSALALAAVAAALFFEPFRQATGGSAGVVATNLVYPLADYLMLLFVSFVVVLTRRWPGRTVGLLILGFAAGTISDSVWAYEVASGQLPGGTVLAAGWPFMALALAYAAWQPRSPLKAVRLRGWSALWLPGSFALIAVALLIYGNLGTVSPPALVLATATLIAACVRGVSLFMEMRDHREQAAKALGRAHDELEARVAERTAALAGLARQTESILASAGEGIWGLDRDGRTVFANGAAAELTGHSAEELLVPRIHDLLHHTKPDGSPYPIEECPVQSTLRDGAVHQVSDELYFRKDGTSFPVEYTSTPIWEDGDVAGAVVVFRDVTESRRGERALRQSEERTRQILAAAHDPFVSIDKDRCIIEWNAAAEETFGWSRAEAIGRPFADTLIARNEGEAPKELGASSESSAGVDRRIELLAIHRDGREFPIELTISPLQTDDGCVFNAFLRDISERRQAERQLQRERDFLDAVLENLREGVVACGPDGVLSLFNRATRELHGISEEALPPEDWPSRYDLLMPDGKTPMGPADVPLRRALRGERVRDAELVIAPKNRPHRRLLCSGQPITGRDGRALGAVVAMHDVTERRRAEEQLVHLALHDSLTGLPNRALLLDRARHALAVARREAGGVAVLFADLDHFKRINDSLGHQIGDELLVALAARLEAALRAADTVGRPDADTVARLGGDEFVVLCEGLASERDAIGIAERIAEALQGPFVVGGEQVFASASIGIVFDHGEGTAEGVLRDADAAMYRAKERGRGRYELFDEAMRARVVYRIRRENELRRAIEQDELRLYYQPIVAVADRRVVAVEALVRWEHPERGLLPPAEFIGLAEESGLIVHLGGWVLHEACRQLARWERSFGDRLWLRVSVNVSARQLAQPRIDEEVKRALTEAGADPGRLALEITETVLMEAGETPVATLEALKQTGCQLVLDDFGTGYSSLSYLRRLPLDMLKLDRSFVAPLRPGGESRDIAAAVVHMAHALDMGIVAEGVESEDQLEVLASLGCDLAQGYLFARPMPALDMTDLLSGAVGGQTLSC